MKRTPLYEKHVELGARMVNFEGWEMPVQYTGVIEEHRAVRQRAGLFDICHMGQIRVEGEDTLDFLNWVLTNRFDDLAVGDARYTFVCNEQGGTIDDVLVYRAGDRSFYRTGDRSFLLVVNAARKDVDFAWLQDHKMHRMVLEDLSEITAFLALQGPLSEKIMQRLTSADLSALGNYRFVEDQVNGLDALIARTGYTGEDGFEVLAPAEYAEVLWDAILEAGEPESLLPCGLGARDTLRLEAGMPLYGHELDEETTPVEAGLTRFVAIEKEDFIGKDALIEQKEKGLERTLVGFEMVDRGIPRHNYEISHGGEVVGRVTSGSYAPTLEEAIGMGYVPRSLSDPGTELNIIIRDKPKKAEVRKRPFYRRGK